MRYLLVASFAALVAACSSSSAAPASAPAQPTPLEAGAADAAVDAAPAGFAPAAHHAPPVVPTAGGPVLASPKIAMVTFAGDPLADALEAFANQIGQSAYWSATTKEYGVGAASFARAVRVAAAPAATLTEDDVEAWLAAQLDGTHPEWGAPDPSTIYTLVYPKGTTISVQGSPICGSSPAYHYEIQLPDKTRVSYALIGRCDPFLGLSGIDFLTAGLSHEWIEAATDPLPVSSPAFVAPPAGKYGAWSLVTGGEVGDMCTLTNTVYFKPPELPFTVQRTWSNAAAAAGHDPCVPAPSAPYFNAAPALDDTVRGTSAGEHLDVEGAAVARGASTTIDVALFSDADTAATWHVRAEDFGQMTGGARALSFAWDAQDGKNGDVLHLTVTRVGDAAGIAGMVPFVLFSSSGHDEHAWVGAVGDRAP